MAKLQPFRGCYYTGISDLAEVVISPDGFPFQTSQHPYAYHLLDFTPAYDQVRDRLKTWFDQGLLTQDDTPAFYVNAQTFSFQGQSHRRLDLFLSLDILDTEVLGHENILPARVSDRHDLLAATETHLSPLFLMYADPQHTLQKHLEDALSQQSPLFALTYQHITHQLYRLPESALHPYIQNTLQHQRFYLADGHHRYAAAKAYAEQRNTPKSRYVFAYVTPLESPGLKVLPYHRYLSPEFVFPEWSGYLAALSAHYHVTPLAHSDLPTLEQALKSPERCWIVQRGTQAWKITECSASQELALDILHTHFLETLAGLPQTEAQQTKYLHFSTDMAAVQYDLLNRGGVAFFVQPTPLTELCARAEAQHMMPPKSTYFYPKVPSGILFNRFSTAV